MHIQELWARIEVLKIARDLVQQRYGVSENSQSRQALCGASVAAEAARMWGFAKPAGEKIGDCDCHKNSTASDKAEATALHSTGVKTLPFAWVKDKATGDYILMVADRKFATIKLPQSIGMPFVVTPNIPGNALLSEHFSAQDAMKRAVAILTDWADKNQATVDEIVEAMKEHANGAA